MQVISYLALIIVAVALPSGTWALDQKVQEECQRISGITTDEVTSKLCTQTCEMDANSALFYVNCGTGKAKQQEIGKSFIDS